MISDIRAIFFDIGDTLRERVPDPEVQAKATQDLFALVKPAQKPDAFLIKSNKDIVTINSGDKRP